MRGDDDHEWRWFHSRAYRARGIPGIVVEAHDITALKEVERKLADTEEFFRQAFEEAPIGLSLAAIDDVGDPVIVRANRLYAHAYGFEPEELEGRAIAPQIHPDDWPAAQAARQRLLSGQSTRERMQVRIIRRDGSALWCTLTRSVLRDQAGTPRFTMAQLEDATETRDMVSQLSALAHSDPLTGLTNRRGLEIELATLLADPVASAHAAVYFLDLDGFKVVNDRLGHREGDVALREVAQRLIGLTRTHDTVARVGGDEFVILARHVGSDAAAALLRDRLAQMEVVVSTDPPATVRASVGLARPNVHDSVQALIDRADRVMYRQKRNARGQQIRA
jgi:diguanylate cyclase (GGDEF)-like protein/PAS domain S-box-containing protein